MIYIQYNPLLVYMQHIRIIKNNIVYFHGFNTIKHNYYYSTTNNTTVIIITTTTTSNTITITTTTTSSITTTTITWYVIHSVVINLEFHALAY